MPSVTFPGGGNQGAARAYSSAWVGIDGIRIPGLVQAGTEQDCDDIGVTSYYVWYVYSQDNYSSQSVANFSINPNDIVAITVSLVDSNGNPAIPGDQAFFDFYDVTTAARTRVTVQRGGVDVSGLTVEWVMERPGLGPPGSTGEFPPLANYGFVQFNFCSAIELAGAVDLPQMNSPKFTMVDNTYNPPLTLSTCNSASTGAPSFTWHAGGG